MLLYCVPLVINNFIYDASEKRMDLIQPAQAQDEDESEERPSPPATAPATTQAETPAGDEVVSAP